MSRCCRTLAAHNEYDTDSLILPLVQGQELSQRIIDAYSDEDIYTGAVPSEMVIISTANAFMRELDRLKPEKIFLSHQKNSNRFSS
jgi:hypothetical protein